MAPTATIPRALFEQWAQKAFNDVKPPSLRTLAKVSGISKSALSYQLNANAIPAASVIKISRGLGRSPLYDLATFPGYESVAIADPESIERREVLTLIGPRDILMEVSHRLGSPHKVESLSAFAPGKESWIQWFKIASPGASYAALGKITGLSEMNISRNHKEAAWSVEYLVLLANHFGFNLRLALLVAGILTFQEVEIDPNFREKALSEASGEELQERVVKFAPSLANLIRTYFDRETKNALHHHIG